MEKIQIRAIRPDDDPVLASIIRDTLAEFGANRPGTVYYDGTTDHLYDLFQEPNSMYLVAAAGQELLGGAGIFPTTGLPPDTCELVKMYLVKAARGLGLGRQLIKGCLNFASQTGYKNVYLESMPELKKALGIYEKFGFRYLEGPMGHSGHLGCSLWMLKNL
jgi:putative acetyltransferase